MPNLKCSGRKIMLYSRVQTSMIGDWVQQKTRGPPIVQLPFRNTILLETYIYFSCVGMCFFYFIKKDAQIFTSKHISQKTALLLTKTFPTRQQQGSFFDNVQVKEAAIQEAITARWLLPDINFQRGQDTLITVHVIFITGDGGVLLLF